MKRKTFYPITGERRETIIGKENDYQPGDKTPHKSGLDQ